MSGKAESHIRWQAHGKAEYMLMHIPIHIAIIELMYCFVMVACLLSVDVMPL